MKELLGGQAVGNALYGIRSLGDSEEVRGLVAALALKIDHRDQWSRRALALRLPISYSYEIFQLERLQVVPVLVNSSATSRCQDRGLREKRAEADLRNV